MITRQQSKWPSDTKVKPICTKDPKTNRKYERIQLLPPKKKKESPSWENGDCKRQYNNDQIYLAVSQEAFGCSSSFTRSVLDERVPDSLKEPSLMAGSLLMMCSSSLVLLLAGLPKQSLMPLIVTISMQSSRRKLEECMFSLFCLFADWVRFVKFILSHISFPFHLHFSAKLAHIWII